jgi:hypothetical protein
MQNRLRLCIHHVHDVENLSDQELINLVKDTEIDIAVNLIGYFGDRARPGIFSNRCAPIQISYMYAGTTGMANMDYIISDEYSIPPQYQKYYSEKIAYLPNCLYTFNNEPKHFNFLCKADLGITKNKFIFICLNAPYKINPNIFAKWCHILNKTSDSILVLRNDNPTVVNNLSSFAKKYGVRDEQLYFINTLNKTFYYSVLHHADLYLDTFPYGSHTIAVEAAWFNLPMLTLTGESFASRISSSVYSCLGVNQLIAKDPEEYTRLGIEISHSPSTLSEIKQKLLNSKTSKIFDHSNFTKNLEEIYLNLIDKTTN